MTLAIDKRRARHAFDQAATSYDQVAELQREMGDRLLSRLEYIRIEPGVVLDIGSGTGVISEKLRKRYKNAKVMAVDFAHSMLMQARKRGSWLRKLPCLCADAEAIPLADNSVDLIVSNAMLQWCNDPEAVFREWLRVMRPGGVLMFTTFGPGTLSELQQAWAAVDDYPHVSRFADMHDIGDALLGGGWEGPVMDIDRFTLTYSDVKGLMRDIKSLGAGNAAVNRQRSLTGKGKMAAMIEAYEAFRTESNLPASYEVVYGHAWAPEQKRIGDTTAIPLQSLDFGRK